jgi:hypothetical protein
MKRRNVLKILACVPFVGWFVPKQWHIFGDPVVEYDDELLKLFRENLPDKPPVIFGKYETLKKLIDLRKEKNARTKGL